MRSTRLAVIVAVTASVAAHAGVASAHKARLAAATPLSALSTSSLQQLAGNLPPGQPTAAQVAAVTGHAPATVGEFITDAQIARNLTPVNSGTNPLATFSLKPARPSGAASAAYCCTQFNGALNYEVYGYGGTLRAAYVTSGISGFTDGPNNDYLASKGNVLLASGSLTAPFCTTNGRHWVGGEDFWGGTSHPIWYHILHLVDVGVGSGGACVSVKEESAATRFNSAGYGDCYNDWGFGPIVACGRVTTQYGPY